LPKKIFLDLVEANRQQLLTVGVPAKSIEASPLCTNCRTDLLFSYRAEKGKTGTDDGRGGDTSLTRKKSEVKCRSKAEFAFTSAF